MGVSAHLTFGVGVELRAGMFSVRSFVALFCVLILAISAVNAAPNRVLMRFGKRGGASEGHVGYRFVPAAAPAVAEYIDFDDALLGQDRF